MARAPSVGAGSSPGCGRGRRVCAALVRAAVGAPRVTPEDARRGAPVGCQPSMRCWVQNEVRSVVVAAWAAALNSDVVETPYRCEVA